MRAKSSKRCPISIRLHNQPQCLTRSKGLGNDMKLLNRRLIRDCHYDPSLISWRSLAIGAASSWRSQHRRRRRKTRGARRWTGRGGRRGDGGRAASSLGAAVWRSDDGREVQLVFYMKPIAKTVLTCRDARVRVRENSMQSFFSRALCQV